jgi:hypothetical protein
MLSDVRVGIGAVKPNSEANTKAPEPLAFCMTQIVAPEVGL